jgi:tetratricopeptide (TPR) repeat protein
MTRRLLQGVLGAALLAAGARADRLHLEGGGVLVVGRWWTEGDMLLYESEAGVIGIPRSLVRRIDPGPPAGEAPTTDGGTASSSVSASLHAPDRGSSDSRRRAVDLFEDGKRQLERREFELASSRFLQAVRLDEDLSAARVGYALSEISLGRDGLALSVVLDGLARHPDNAELHEVLGDLRNREERVEEAVGSWRRAFNLAPSDRLREKITKAERELHAARDYALSTTSHFNVRYDSDVDSDLASSVKDYLEEQYWALADRLQHAPPQPITVLLYPTRQFHDVTQSPEGVGGLYDGKIRVPLGGLRRLDPRARGVLTHELTHAIVHSKTRGNCPQWLHEGLAQWLEGRQLTPGEEQAIARLLAGGDPAGWQSRQFSYPAALSLARHLESLRGFEGLLELLELLGDGLPQDEALGRVYGVDYAGLCRGWAAGRGAGSSR